MPGSTYDEKTHFERRKLIVLGTKMASTHIHSRLLNRQALCEHGILLLCSRESLTEKAANIEKTIVDDDCFYYYKSSLVPLIEGLCVKEHERARYDFDPTMFYENRFWNQRPDGIIIAHYTS